MAGSASSARELVNAAMPYLRRYGRALSGSQHIGDSLAGRARRIARRHSIPASPRAARVALFGNLHALWSAGSNGGFISTPFRHRTPRSRETLLLRTVEAFSFEEIGEILETNVETAERLFDIALLEMPRLTQTRVLLIEDDVIIAMDMSAQVSGLGCDVIGVARTATEAVVAARENPPDLVIADLVLADRSSGFDAARTIAREQPSVTVVFLSGYPERLLTGQGEEPVFVIAKPCLDEQVRSALTQAIILNQGAQSMLRSGPDLLGARPGEKPDDEADERQHQNKKYP